LKEAKHDVISPELPNVVKPVDDVSTSSKQENKIMQRPYPNSFVQIPIIPHSGIRIVTTFVTAN